MKPHHERWTKVTISDSTVAVIGTGNIWDARARRGARLRTIDAWLAALPGGGFTGLAAGQPEGDVRGLQHLGGDGKQVGADLV